MEKEQTRQQPADASAGGGRDSGTAPYGGTAGLVCFKPRLKRHFELLERFLGPTLPPESKKCRMRASLLLTKRKSVTFKLLLQFFSQGERTRT